MTPKMFSFVSSLINLSYQYAVCNALLYSSNWKLCITKTYRACYSLFTLVLLTLQFADTKKFSSSQLTSPISTKSIFILSISLFKFPNFHILFNLLTFLVRIFRWSFLSLLIVSFRITPTQRSIWTEDAYPASILPP